MTPKERILMIRLIDKLEKHRAYSGTPAITPAAAKSVQEYAPKYKGLSPV